MTKQLLAAAALAAAACAATATPAPHTQPATQAGPHENLNAVVWMQTAVEFEATALQAYRLAEIQMEAALKDPSWTAAIEQTANASTLPPAVIVDVDETVLDNSFYQARMIRDRTEYSAATWDPWVEEARATPIPGALEFTRQAAAKGVTVFYVTNRTANLEEATRRNLAALGFPLPQTPDVVLTRGERPEWQASAKGPRRAHVARDYRILLLIGDDLGDFVVDPSGTPAERHARTAPQADWWGRRWIMLPNPTYGSWERAIVGNAKDPIAARRAALKYEPDQNRSR
ncbi:MAG TPA: HAD family acid phosphatase [Vicinamibacterales bacterium]|nr:HAD family acid phosphatase [Vicinamibacterales bacterium]